MHNRFGQVVLQAVWVAGMEVGQSSNSVCAALIDCEPTLPVNVIHWRLILGRVLSTSNASSGVGAMKGVGSARSYPRG